MLNEDFGLQNLVLRWWLGQSGIGLAAVDIIQLLRGLAAAQPEIQPAGCGCPTSRRDVGKLRPHIPHAKNLTESQTLHPREPSRPSQSLKPARPGRPRFRPSPPARQIAPPESAK